MVRPQLPRAVINRRTFKLSLTSFVSSYRPLASTFRSLSSSSSSHLSSNASSSTSKGPGFSTINESEISHFSKLSSQWWDTKGEFGLLHRMNPARVEYIRRKLCFPSIPIPSTSSSSSSSSKDDSNTIDPLFASSSKFKQEEPEWKFETRHSDYEKYQNRGTGNWLQGFKILDVGCGGGLLSESIARLGGDVLGVDASESNINIAKIHASKDPFLPFVNDPSDLTAKRNWNSKGSLEYRCTSAEVLHDAGEKFDLVCSMEVLEHVDQPGEFLKCLGDMVKPGGHLILSTISRTPLSKLLTLTLAEQVLRLVTPGTHTYSKFVKPNELRSFLYTDMGGYDIWHRNSNATDIRNNEVGETRGIVYDPLKGEWILWDGAEGTWGKELGEGCNYMFHARKKGDLV